MTTILIVSYWLIVAVLSIYGLLGLYTLWQYSRHRQDEFPCPPLPEDPPTVTIQLPLYNEPYVVKRLIRTAVNQQYPRHRLQIQVIDDSTDITTNRASRLVEQYKRKGIDISLIHRTERTGYKAGALAHALPEATGEFIAIFDADFQIEPDFLQQTIPHFYSDDRLGMVQTRWGHLNDGESALTAVQAIALDKHFAIDQTVRHHANLFPKFNGAAGVWRKACIDEACGWQDDTVCEDLCLSTRAVLSGWRFRFLPHVVIPAELPSAITAYKSQQARWAKGSFQCLLKHSRAVITTPGQSLAARLVALLTMAAYLTNPLLILLLLLQIPLILVDYQPSAWMLIFTLISFGQPLLFIAGQQVLHPDWWWRLRHLPTLLVIAVGLSPANTRAILQVGYGRTHTFIRTPKQGHLTNPRYQAIPFDWLILAELFLAGYALAGIVLALYLHNTASLLFLLTCALGLGYVTWLSLRETTFPQIISHPTKVTSNQNQ